MAQMEGDEADPEGGASPGIPGGRRRPLPHRRTHPPPPPPPHKLSGDCRACPSWGVGGVAPSRIIFP
ncbi:hypothetical protein GQ55_7G059800 [Panicum hallii var. hallii]|uniref:Uncharacterized protein n=1 Tax=Panicum hallii var. hallii TaxID=1504633 RepID=A0A2T7CSK5_9POAL|nr:hypothetical protein GQ55_7G059800 [Panicum hallii var. hallii]